MVLSGRIAGVMDAPQSKAAVAEAFERALKSGGGCCGGKR